MAADASPTSINESVIVAEGRLEPVEFAQLAFLANGVVANIMVNEGDTIADFSHWIIKTTDLSEVDVVDVQVGQGVVVTFDALPDVELHGKVQSISSVFSDTQGEVTYEVTISLSESDPAMRWE